MDNCMECIHGEMCKWQDELNGNGCDFFNVQESCDDAISRHKAIVMITAYEGKSAQIKALKELSPVNPRPQGEWIKIHKDNHQSWWYRCSICDRLFDMEYPYHYCPHCGAKMKREGEEQ